MTVPLNNRFVAHLSVDVGLPISLGDTPEGRRRIVPILGGRIDGPDISGVVVGGGVDSQIQITETRTEVDASYAIRTHDDATVFVHNVGIRVADPADTAAIVRGESVPADRIYFMTLPRLSTTCARLAWLNDRLFVGRGERLPASVEIDVFLLN